MNRFRPYRTAYSYTPADDAEINRLRLAGATWDAIGKELGRGAGATVRQRAILAGLPCIQMGPYGQILGKRGRR